MKRNKIVAFALASLMGVTSVGVLSSCGTRKPGGLGAVVESAPVVDDTKSILTVATFDGGVGHEWLQEAALRFEELHTETVFESGKKGVIVDVAYDKDNYGGTVLAEKTLNKDVYFTEGIEYYRFVNDGKVADITDVVDGTFTTYGQEVDAQGQPVSIESKLDPSFKSYFTEKDGRYYMLPFYDGFYGFIYDVDLFEQEGYYFDEDGDTIKKTPGETQKSFDDRKSTGPDGIAGNYDDGLPKTYEQFVELIDIISINNVPFCYSGNYNDYVSKAFRSFIADYEGEAFKLNYTLTGNDVELINVDDSGNVTTFTEDITPENAYLLKKQAGNYYALMMQEKLFGSTKYIGGNWNAFDFTEAQSEFIMSKYTARRYAMLIDGVWWENEATKVFTDLEFRGDTKASRRFGFLPIPKQNVDRAGNQTMLSANSSFCFINKQCKNMDLAKEFMRFIHTDVEMSHFSAKTSITRSLNYTVTAEDRAKATHFGKTLIDMRAQATVIYPYSTVDLVLDNPSAFTEQMWYLTAKINNSNFNNPFNAFRDNTATAIQYFNGLYTFQNDVWPTLER